MTAHVTDGEYYYYSRTKAGKQYSIYCRKAGSMDAAEEILLDLYVLAEQFDGGPPDPTLLFRADEQALFVWQVNKRACVVYDTSVGSRHRTGIAEFAQIAANRCFGYTEFLRQFLNRHGTATLDQINDLAASGSYETKAVHHRGEVRECDCISRIPPIGDHNRS